MLTHTERFLIVKQLEILAQVDPENSERHLVDKQVLESGFEGEYDRLLQHIQPDVLTPDQCNEVRRILVLFLDLQYVAKTGGLDDVEPENLTFWGFSENDEFKLWSYARFLLSSTSPGFEDLLVKSGLNSHAPKLDVYRRMLDSAAQSKNPNQLTVDDVKRILAARSA